MASEKSSDALLGQGTNADQNAPPTLPLCNRGRSTFASMPPFSKCDVNFGVCIWFLYANRTRIARSLCPSIKGVSSSILSALSRNVIDGLCPGVCVGEGNGEGTPSSKFPGLNADMTKAKKTTAVNIATMVPKADCDEGVAGAGSSASSAASW